MNGNMVDANHRPPTTHHEPRELDMKARLISTVVTVLAVAATAACGGGGSSTSSSSAGGKTLTYWASNQGTSLENDKAVLGPELAKFEKQTGVKVNLQVIGWPDLLNKIPVSYTHLRAHETRH